MSTLIFSPWEGLDGEARRGMGGGMGRKQVHHHHRFIRGIRVANRTPFDNAMANVAVMERLAHL